MMLSLCSITQHRPQEDLGKYRFLVYQLAYAKDVEASALYALRSQLPVEERKRYDHLTVYPRQIEFLLSRILLRSVLGMLLCQPPSLLRFAATIQGKPYLEGYERGPPAFFNLSHTQGCIMLAVTKYGEIGVDVEALGSYQERVARRFFHHDEYCSLERLPPSQRSIAFYHMWTIKEACAKALGSGLQFPLREIPVSLEASGYSRSCWWQTLDFSPAFKAAIALYSPGAFQPPKDFKCSYLDIQWLSSSVQ